MRLYSRLAWNGIKKNKRLYVPFLLTCIGMAAMFYITSYLTYSPILLEHRTATFVMSLGRVVIAVFSLILLFYTNSFLLRRRQKEFGLYNILGMNKWNIGRVLLRETFFTFTASLSAGLALGILFSKLAELFFVRIVRGEITFDFTVSPESVAETAAVFGAIFLLLLLFSLAKLRLSNPLQLLRSENAGEKPPRANWVFAALGAVVLIAAYVIAVSIQEPMTAIAVFFIAVVMVILATYLLFIAGSVALCRILQKRKNYYYRANHFVSVSSMVYRMKRNGAGLASICILSTMVLVMLSSTCSLMIGAEDALNRQYPYDITAHLTFRHPESRTAETLEALRTAAADAAQGRERDLIAFEDTEFAGYLEETGNVRIRQNGNETLSLALSQMCGGYVISLEDYNTLSGNAYTLAPDEVLIWSTGKPYPFDHFSVADGPVYTVKDRLTEFPPLDGYTEDTFETYYIAIPDLASFSAALQEGVERAFAHTEGSVLMPYYYQYVCFNMDADAETRMALQATISWRLSQFMDNHDDARGYGAVSKAEQRAEFYNLNGSLFFLGVLLSLVFVSAAVLIIYYKQVSEGYEDAGRFEIMRNVGMTDRDIRRSINSQVLTVFFAPLLLAGLHLAFAFPLVWKIVRLFGVSNLPLLIGTNAVCFLIFALFYVVVYRVTARVYYHIVRGAEGN